MKVNDITIHKLRGTVDELADAVAKRERHGRMCQTESEYQVRWHKEEWERLHARVAAVEAQLVACGRSPLKPISALPSTSGYQPQQGQKGLGGKCAMARLGMAREPSSQDGSTWRGKKTRDLNHQGSGNTISEWTLHLVYIENLAIMDL